MAAPHRITELITTISQDDALRQRLAAASDDITRIGILASAGFNDITLTDIHAALSADDKEIGDAELSKVAGGGLHTAGPMDLLRELVLDPPKDSGPVRR